MNDEIKDLNDITLNNKQKMDTYERIKKNEYPLSNIIATDDNSYKEEQSILDSKYAQNLLNLTRLKNCKRKFKVKKLKLLKKMFDNDNVELVDFNYSDVLYKIYHNTKTDKLYLVYNGYILDYVIKWEFDKLHKSYDMWIDIIREKTQSEILRMRSFSRDLTDQISALSMLAVSNLNFNAKSYKEISDAVKIKDDKIFITPKQTIDESSETTN